MKKIMFIALAALLAISTVISASAAPIAASVVESASELAGTADDAQASVSADYVPTEEEYLNLNYGEVIAWGGYSEFTVGAEKPSSTIAYSNPDNASGNTGISYLNQGTIGQDEEDGNKYLIYNGVTGYPGINGGAKAKAGVYTHVVRARKGSSTVATPNMILRIRAQKYNEAEDKWADSELKSATHNLTDTFAEYTVSVEYTPSNTIRLKDLCFTGSANIEIDSWALYYKPFDDYERPQYGELVAWDGFENYKINDTSSGSAAVFNKSTTSGVTYIGVPSGTVYAEKPTGNKYVIVKNTSWPGIGGGKTNAKAGVYTHVVRARKTANGATNMVIRIRTHLENENLDENTAEKTCALTDEFQEYTISYNYVPSANRWLKDLTFSAGTGVEVDSWALYYTPFEAPETLDKSSIRTSNDEYQGMRYAAYVTEEQKKISAEYGFLIALEPSFADDDYTKLVFDANMSINGTNENGIKYVSGANYVANTSTDKIFSTDGKVFDMDKEGIYFTAVVYNIKDYSIAIVARPYLKLSNGDVYYGDPISKSIKDVAQAYVNTNYGGIVDDAPEFVQEILKQA